MKILIVEDDTLLLQGLILAAQTEGYACDGVSTARMAEQSLEAGHYSLVVLDLGLPDEDGLHFLARIRQKKYTLPVLILTARDTTTSITGTMSPRPTPWKCISITCATKWAKPVSAPCADLAICWSQMRKTN